MGKLDSETRYELWRRDEEIENLKTAKHRIKREIDEQASLLASANDELGELKREIDELKAHIELVDKQLSRDVISLTERIDRLSDRLEKHERAKN